MKFNFHIIGLAVLLSLISCTKEQEGQRDVGLFFKAEANDALSKGVKVGLTELRNRGFLVYANTRKGESASTTPFMNAQKLTYSTSGWTYSPTKYWPNDSDASVDFYAAYTDESENVKILYDWYNKPQTTFYVNKTVSKQTDMLWAAPVLGAKKENYVSTPVTFTFKHSLTGFSFSIKLAADKTDVQARVTSLTLTGFFAPKAYIIPDETDIKKAYSLQGDWQERSYTLYSDGDEEINPAVITGPLTTTKTDITGNKGFIMVLPFEYQEYTVTLGYETTHGSVTVKKTASHTVTGVELKAGTFINTLLILDLDKDGSAGISSTVTITDWKDIIAEQDIISAE